MKDIISIVILFLWLFVIPTVVGRLAAIGVDKRKVGLPFLWISGQMLLWAGFQVICVPMVLKQLPFSPGAEGKWLSLVPAYLAYTAVLVLSALLVFVIGCWKRKSTIAVIKGYSGPKAKWYYILWAVFWVLLAFQLVMAVLYTYGDGDDAFYVAVATITEESNTMYLKLPYTGGTTGLDSRHGLAPFPVWIAFLARISGMRTVSVAHVVVPLMLIPMTYGIYYLIGSKLCRKNTEKLPLFLVLSQLLVLFGDYSFYTVENFMIARSRQGKAALGSIIFPFLIFLLLTILERLQEKQKIELIWWILLAAAVTAACLCSTLGTFLSCLLVGVTGLCTAISYRKWKLLIPMVLCCVPAVGYALLYLVLS